MPLAGNRNKFAALSLKIYPATPLTVHYTDFNLGIMASITPHTPSPKTSAIGLKGSSEGRCNQLTGDHSQAKSIRCMI